MKKSNREKYPLLFKKKYNNKYMETRYRKAWERAKQAGDILKKEFGAEWVWVFGSLTDKARFNERSDIDLAVSGIPEERFYAAFSKISRVIRDFEVDLVDIADCRNTVRRQVEEEGVLI